MTVDAEYLTSQQVADLLGIKRRSVWEQTCRGNLPKPDLVLMRHPLWLPETIDEHIKNRGKHKKRRRRKRRKQTVAASPPKDVRIKDVDFNPIDGITDERAREVAAELRKIGQHCTAQDVHELAAADPAGLGYEDRRLQQRIRARLRS